MMKEQLIARIMTALDTHKQHGLLSDWDIGYCESILTQVERRGTLSEKQLTLLSKIEGKCSVESIDEALSWSKEYKDLHRSDALICAKYYKTAGYFTGLASCILLEPDFVPPRQAYKKMCENKYAQKVLATAKAKPVFPVGSTVELRKPALGWKNKRLESVPCLVIEALSEVVSPAKGAKQYNILPYGEIQPVLVEERQIKKCKHNKTPKRQKVESDDDILF